jgi:hypothetical protein
MCSCQAAEGEAHCVELALTVISASGDEQPFGRPISTKLSKWQGIFSYLLSEFHQMCKYVYLLCQMAGGEISVGHVANTSNDTVLDRSKLQSMGNEVCVDWLVIEHYIYTKGQPLNQHSIWADCSSNAGWCRVAGRIERV